MEKLWNDKLYLDENVLMVALFCFLQTEFLALSYRKKQKETNKIYRLVEQMLYYVRSENTEKKVSFQIYDVENVVYTDEKWLHFILSRFCKRLSSILVRLRTA